VAVVDEVGEVQAALVAEDEVVTAELAVALSLHKSQHSSPALAQASDSCQALVGTRRRRCMSSSCSSHP
jgi:hypothetical protein